MYLGPHIKIKMLMGLELERIGFQKENDATGSWFVLGINDKQVQGIRVGIPYLGNMKAMVTGKDGRILASRNFRSLAELSDWLFVAFDLKLIK